MNLPEFRQKLHEYRRVVGLTQKTLAQEVGLHPDVLSHKLNNIRNASLTVQEIRQIVKILAGKAAITAQSEAIKLLQLMDLKPTTFSPEDWNSFPLNRLERIPTASSPLFKPSSKPIQPRHNLPNLPTSLVGREELVQSIIAKSNHDQVQLVTLIGPGGIGKTRLAIQVAHQMINQFEHGVWLVSLAAIFDANLVASEITRVLGIREEADNLTPAEFLEYYLVDKNMLLVLDNFEQVLEASNLIGDLLAKAPGLKMLITSRSVLHLYGEHEIDVPPLQLPVPDTNLLFTVLRQYEAVRLFYDRVKLVQPQFNITEANATLVQNICILLDGLPLAIELAAARAKLLSLQDILAWLDSTVERKLELLTGGARNLPGRQQTIRNTLEWSFNLLDAEEKEIFAYLGVFRNGWTLEAIQAVCPSSGELLDKLGSLLDKSLIRLLRLNPDESPNLTKTNTRYGMLAIIREYALERLKLGENYPVARQRHASYYLELAEYIDNQLNGEVQINLLDELEREHDNLRAALDWTLESAKTATNTSYRTQQIVMATRLVAALCSFWFMRSHWNEARGWLKTVLSLDKEYQPLPSRAKALLTLANLAKYQGDYEQSAVLFEESRTIYLQLGDQRGLAACLHQQATLAADDNADYQKAIELHRQSLRIYRELGDTNGVANVELDLAWALNWLGEYDQSMQLLEGCLSHYNNTGDQKRLVWALAMMGLVEWQRGNPAKGKKLMRQSHSYIGLSMNGKWWQINSIMGFAGIIIDLGELEYAVRLIAAQQKLSETFGTVLPSIGRTRKVAVLKYLKEKLGLEHFNKLWEQGQSLSLEEVFEYMLDENSRNFQL